MIKEFRQRRTTASDEGSAFVQIDGLIKGLTPRGEHA